MLKLAAKIIWAFQQMKNLNVHLLFFSRNHSNFHQTELLEKVKFKLSLLKVSNIWSNIEVNVIPTLCFAQLEVLGNCAIRKHDSKKIIQA